MPANLTPEYEKAELRFRQATTDAERIEALQGMLAAIPKHKGTEKMQADLKRRLSQLRRAEQKSGQPKGPDPFHIPKSGAGQVVIIGPPNTGKSSLLAATTHAAPKIADYPFTTTIPLPGMWQQDDVQIELIDTPPLTREHIPPGLFGTIRNADLIAVMVEAGESTFEQVELVLSILRERGLVVTSSRATSETADGTQPRPGLVVVNKIDTAAADLETLQSLYFANADSLHLEFLGISTRSRQGLDKLFARLWELLGKIRVYTKEPGRAADLHKPFVVPVGATVADLALQIHRDLPEQMKYARLWGHSRFEGQQVHKTEVLRDRDIVEIHE